MMAATPRTRWVKGTLRAIALAAGLVGAPGGDGVHAQGSSGDAEAKVRFTMTVARFVQWPPTALHADAAPLKICVLHDSAALGAAFAVLGGQQVAGRPVQVALNPRDRRDCSLFFVDTSAAHGSAEALAAAAGSPSLTLGAVDGFLSQGGMIELTNVDDMLRFDVNLKALRSARLDMSSKALRLARQVRN